MSDCPSAEARQLLQMLLTGLQAALYSQSAYAMAPQAILAAKASSSWQPSQLSHQPSV